MSHTVPEIDAVVLSQGTDLPSLHRCIDSLLAQTGVKLNVVCVGNGWEVTGLPSDVEAINEPTNIGAPAGRNVGAAFGSAPYILFFDDDAWFADTNAVATLVAYMERRSDAGLVQPRLVDPVNGRTEPRWVPRSMVGDPSRPGPAFTISEGASLVRRALFEDVGGWAAEFFYGHEGIELTWQTWNHGYSARYLPQVIAHHPSGAPFRRPKHMWMNARNRVWVARRNLPAPIRQWYLFNWLIISMIRLNRDPAARKEWLRGWRAGKKSQVPAGGKHLSWKTVIKLALLGHPPIV